MPAKKAKEKSSEPQKAINNPPPQTAKRRKKKKRKKEKDKVKERELDPRQTVCGDPLSEVSFAVSVVENRIEYKRVIRGYIVNIAAYFNLNLSYISVYHICLCGLASLNRFRFGAGTERVCVMQPNPYYSGDYNADCSRFLQDHGYNSLDDYYAEHGMGEHGTNPPIISLPVLISPTQSLTALLFESGRVVLIGPSNEYGSRNGASLVVLSLKKLLGIHAAQMKEYRTVNVVVTFHLGFKVNLAKLAENEVGFLNYHPGLFPAVIIHSGAKITLLVNETGNCILTGSDSVKGLHEFLKKHFPLLFKYRYAEVPGDSSVVITPCPTIATQPALEQLSESDNQCDILGNSLSLSSANAMQGTHSALRASVSRLSSSLSGNGEPDSGTRELQQMMHQALDLYTRQQKDVGVVESVLEPDETSTPFPKAWGSSERLNRVLDSLQEMYCVNSEIPELTKLSK